MCVELSLLATAELIDWVAITLPDVWVVGITAEGELGKYSGSGIISNYYMAKYHPPSSTLQLIITGIRICKKKYFGRILRNISTVALLWAKKIKIFGRNLP